MVADWLEQVGHGSRLVRASGSMIGLICDWLEHTMVSMGFDHPPLRQSLCRTVLSNLFDPAGHTKHNYEAAGHTSKLKSND